MVAIANRVYYFIQIKKRGNFISLLSEVMVKRYTLRPIERE